MNPARWTDEQIRVRCLISIGKALRAAADECDEQAEVSFSDLAQSRAKSCARRIREMAEHPERILDDAQHQ